MKIKLIRLLLTGVWCGIVVGASLMAGAAESNAPTGAGKKASESQDSAPDTADEPFTSSFSAQAAAGYLDARAHLAEKGCFACHSTFTYLPGRSAMDPLAKAAMETRVLLERFTAMCLDPSQIVKIKTSHVDQVRVLAAVELARHDAVTTGKLQPITRQALDSLWQFQRGDGSVKWLHAGEAPQAVDDYWPVAMVALGTGSAPEGYAQTEKAKAGIEKLRGWLRAHPPKNSHERGLTLLAHASIGGLLSDEERRGHTEALFATQREDGGWSLAGLADWQRPDKKPLDPTRSDGYGTGFVTFVLARSGIPPAEPRLHKAVEWLKTHQRRTGGWFTPSPFKQDKIASNTGTSFAVQALAACGEIPAPKVSLEQFASAHAAAAKAVPADVYLPNPQANTGNQSGQEKPAAGTPQPRADLDKATKEANRTEIHPVAKNQNGATAPSAPKPSPWPGRLGIVVFQFDDGTSGHYTHAFPILEKYQLKGSFAVITGNLGRGGSLTRAQVVEMHRAGHEIHDHTLDHDAALWGDPARRDEWLKQIDQSLGILKELGITTRGWNQPGGKGARWTPELREVLAPRYDYVAGRVDLKHEQLNNAHWHLKDDPLCLSFGGVSGWGPISRKDGPAKEEALMRSRIADGIQQGQLTIPLWHVVQDADGSAWGLEEICKFVRRHNLPSMAMADAVRAAQHPRDFFEASVEQMPNPTFAVDYDENGQPDGWPGSSYAPPEITSPNGGRVAQWSKGTMTWIYGPEPGPTRLALNARSADGKPHTVTPIVTITEIDQTYHYTFCEPQQLAPMSVGPDWQESQTSLTVPADADRAKIEFEMTPSGEILVSQASWRTGDE